MRARLVAQTMVGSGWQDPSLGQATRACAPLPARYRAETGNEAHPATNATAACPAARFGNGLFYTFSWARLTEAGCLR